MSDKIKPEFSSFKNNGLEGIMFCAGGYRAVILPDRGANVITLENVELGASLLRTPESEDSYDKAPYLYGIPILFPPNRIDAGRFSFCGRHYLFPINEPGHNNHLHGFLSDAAWNVETKSVKDDCAEITVSFENNHGCTFFKHYPHLFKISIVYRLSGNGLYQQTVITNNGKDEMPIGLGFHTTFNLPFHPEGSINSIILQMSVDGKWELDDRMLPTGKKLYPRDWEAGLCKNGIAPLAHPLDNHYPGKPININGRRFNGAMLTDTSAKLRIVYEVGESYKHWMLYNGMDSRRDFICPEPQTWMVNAPNINKPVHETGLIALAPGSTWKDYTRIWVERI